MRTLADDVLVNASDVYLREEVIHALVCAEDEERTEALLAKYASGESMTRSSLLRYRYGYRKEFDKERYLSQQETAQALSKKHNFPLDDQLAFTETSRRKLQDYTIVDFIERNARDPIRKLGPDDRLIGSARLVLEQGFMPENLCTAAAAAIYYNSPGDESAEQLKQMRETEGVEAVIEKVCKLEKDGVLGRLILEKVALLKEKGWIHE